jgi:hypothetical protein
MPGMDIPDNDHAIGMGLAYLDSLSSMHADET